MQYYAFDDSCQALIGNYLSTTTGELIPARCKKWSCKFCGPRAARRFVARVMRTRRFTYFITLTSRPHGALDASTIRKFNACFRSFRQWLKRECGLGDVTWTLERGEKTGHLHRHALIDTNRSFSYKRARAALVRTGHGAVCDFKPSRSAQSAQAGARYLGKYLAKNLSLHSTEWPKYSRRCQTSTPPLPKPDQQYIFIPKPQLPWRRRPESATPLVNEFWHDSEMPGWQLPIALNQKEKLRHEVNDGNVLPNESTGLGGDGGV